MAARSLIETDGPAVQVFGRERRLISATAVEVIVSFVDLAAGTPSAYFVCRA